LTKPRGRRNTAPALFLYNLLIPDPELKIGAWRCLGHNFDVSGQESKQRPLPISTSDGQLISRTNTHYPIK